MRATHRSVAPPPYQMPRQVNGVWTKLCRWCLKPLLKPDGSMDGRRNWHPECVDAFMIRRSAEWLRRLTFKRDGGICRQCGKDCAYTGAWEADHIVPLIDGGSFDMENIQTLCSADHQAKTAREATARARARRISPDQMTLDV